MADNWKQKALRYGLVGGGLGAAGSLILNAIHRMQGRPKPVEQLVPKTIVEQPYFIDEDQARQLKERGVDVRMPSFGKVAGLRRELYDRGECFSDIVESKTHLKFAGGKTGNVGEWMGEGITDIALPMAAGLGGGYLGFRGVDWLFDKMHRDSAKEQYEEKRKQLQRMMHQMNRGLGKVASDRMHGGCLDRQMVAFLERLPEISKIAGEVMRAQGLTKQAFFEGLGESVLRAGKTPMKGYGALLGGAGLLAATAALPAALRAFKKRNPNTQVVRDIEDYYRGLPDQPRIKLVPTLRRPPRAHPRREEDEEEDEVIPGPGYKAAAATNPSLAGQPVHSSVEPPTIDTSPDQPTDDLSERPGVPASNPQPATAGPASQTAMPHPNPQMSASPDLPSPGLSSAQMPSFSGRFSGANIGFTRNTPGNMPQPKDPAARSPKMTANIGNAVA